MRTASATSALTFVGTEGFVPPEGPGTPGADVFSLGKVLYELATGMDRNEFPRLPPAFSTWDDAAAFLELNAVVLRACDPRRERRHADAAALLEDLLLLQAGRSVRRLRLIEWRLGQALRAVALLAAAAAVAGGGAWVAWSRAEREMAARAAAEAAREAAKAERDALARQTVYAATLARAQRSLEDIFMEAVE